MIWDGAWALNGDWVHLMVVSIATRPSGAENKLSARPVGTQVSRPSMRDVWFRG